MEPHIHRLSINKLKVEGSNPFHWPCSRHREALVSAFSFKKRAGGFWEVMERKYGRTKKEKSMSSDFSL